MYGEDKLGSVVEVEAAILKLVLRTIAFLGFLFTLSFCIYSALHNGYILAFAYLVAMLFFLYTLQYDFETNTPT